MAQLRRELVVKRTLLGQHLRIMRRFVRFIQDQLLVCSCSCSPKATRYRRITRSPVTTHAVAIEQPLTPSAVTGVPPSPSPPVQLDAEYSEGDDLDVVSIKISLLGDCQIGKTSFMAKYVGGEEDQRGLQMTGLNLMDKILFVRGARIMFSIWDVGGDQRFLSHVPVACKDAAAILIMFDLTCRRTLTNSMGWYQQARRWNKTGIPILIGTKFDDFVQLPLDLQWTIVTQARAYARAMKATLFFSSATHDINVSKIFKFIAAKFFNSPWTVERNLTLGEPIIDF